MGLTILAFCAGSGVFAAAVIRLFKLLGPQAICPHCQRRTANPDWRERDPAIICTHCHRRFHAGDRPESTIGTIPEIHAKPGPQVVGQDCAVCGRRVVFDSEAEPCSTCGRAVHLSCLPHRHDGGAGTPYRD